MAIPTITSNSNNGIGTIRMTSTTAAKPAAKSGGSSASASSSSTTDDATYDKKDLNKDGVVTAMEEVKYDLKHASSQTTTKVDALA
jgi:hypothetical protein